MKVTVWGAGRTGVGCVRRLVISSVIDEVRWINRTSTEVEWRRLDIEHGLAYAPI